MKFLKNKRVLFIGPKFYNYHIEIIDSLKSLGAEVVFFPHLNLNIIFRIMKNYDTRMQVKYVNRYYHKIQNKIRSIEFEYLLLISGKWTPKWFLGWFTDEYPASVRVMYQWDSVSNNQNAINIAKYFNKCFSFDLSDCYKYDFFDHLPLFCSAPYSNAKLRTNETIDMVFIGNALSNRYYLLESLKRIFIRNNLKFEYYLYLPFIQYLKEYFIKKNRIPFRDIRFKKLSMTDVVKIVSNSRAVLDIHNVNQSGLTMRTIEALCLGKKLLTTNKFILKYYPKATSQIRVLENDFDYSVVEFIRDSLKNKDRVSVLDTTEWLLIIFSIKRNRFINLF